MLNHVEKPLTLGVLKKTIERAKEVGLTTIVCADSIVEASMIAKLDPDIIVAEPSELIGTGLTNVMEGGDPPTGLQLEFFRALLPQRLF